MRRTEFSHLLRSPAASAGNLASVALAASFALAVASCSRAPSEPSAGAEPAAPAAPAASTVASPHPTAGLSAAHRPMPTPGSSAHPLALKWDDPPRWQRRTPSTAMRAAEYRIPRLGQDAQDAECFVITFGPGQGGSIDDNIERWVKQMEPRSTTVERTQRAVNGMNVTRVEVAGTYTPMAMPTMPSETTAARQGQRLVGEIVEAPSGTWFFKMVGPDATVSGAGKELDKLVESIQPS